MFEQEQRELAEAKLTRAAQQLRELRRQAFFGDFDSDEYDQAIITYRRAVGEAQDARTVHDAGIGLAAAPPAAHTIPDASFVPTPQMRFVKWLVETGRLFDQ